jgi:hypothetical protein
MLSGHGLPEIPPGGSLESRLKSRIRRLLQLVDYNQTRHEQKIHERDRQNKLTMTVVTGESWVCGHQAAPFLRLVLHRGLVSLLSRGDPVFNHLVSPRQQPCDTLPEVLSISSPEMNAFMQLKLATRTVLYSFK